MRSPTVHADGVFLFRATMTFLGGIHGTRPALPNRPIRNSLNSNARRAPRRDRSHRRSPHPPPNRRQKPHARATRHALPPGRLDGPPACAPHRRQPHERPGALQACTHRRRAHPQDLRRKSVGRARGHENPAGRTFARIDRQSPYALGHPSSLAHTATVPPQVPPLRMGLADRGLPARAVRLAWPASRRAHYLAAPAQRLGLSKPPRKRPALSRLQSLPLFASVFSRIF